MNTVRTMWKRWVVILAIVIAIPTVGKWLINLPSSNEPDPAALAERIGAASCEKTSFTIESKLDGETRTVYDCYFKGDYRYRCVTESDNIAKDETDTVIALLEDTFETEKPRCA